MQQNIFTKKVTLVRWGLFLCTLSYNGHSQLSTHFWPIDNLNSYNLSVNISQTTRTFHSVFCPKKWTITFIYIVKLLEFKCFVFNIEVYFLKHMKNKLAILFLMLMKGIILLNLVILNWNISDQYFCILKSLERVHILKICVM